jgi:hypothetical protein
MSGSWFVVRRNPAALWLPVASVVAGAAIVSLVAIAHGRLSETDGRIIVTVLPALLTGGATIAALELIERRRWRPIAWLVLAGAPVEFAFMELAIWTFVDESKNRYTNWGWTALFWVLPSLFIPTLLLFAHRRLARAVVPVVSISTIAVAGLLTGVLWTSGDHDGVGRVTAALGVLAVAGYLIEPALERGLPRRDPTIS